MKKALLIASLALGSIMLTSAQVNITGGTIGGNVGGVPFGVAVGGNSVSMGAAGQINAGPLVNIVRIAGQIVAALVPILIAVAVVTFFWNLIRYVIAGGENGEARGKALAGMGYALIALFIMVSLWGIINFAGNILGIGQGGSVPIPSVPIPQ